MLEEKILNDYKEAMKAKDTAKVATLSFLRSQMINTAIAKKKKTLEDNEVIAVIRQQIKAHQDSIEQFKAGNRQDLVEKESKELEILKSYLPPELSLDEIKRIIEEAVTKIGAKDMKDMGKVMKEVTEKISNRADPKLVSDLVKQRLTSSQA